MRRCGDGKKDASCCTCSFSPAIDLYVGLGQRLQVMTTPGVHMILSHGDRVAIISKDEIFAIRRTVQEDCRVVHPFLKCGERVRVTRGSLSGVEGILVRKKNVSRPSSLGADTGAVCGGRDRCLGRRAGDLQSCSIVVAPVRMTRTPIYPAAMSAHRVQWSGERVGSSFSDTVEDKRNESMFRNLCSDSSECIL